MSFSAFDHAMMARALQLAAKGLNSTTPNPRVGCVLVDAQQQVIGEGFHEKAGEPHAEVLALQAAQDNTHGATAYVTLEPCSHVGRTGPCADALIQAGITRVVYAMEDPNPSVSGRGLEKLRAAGIRVDGSLNEDQARELNCGFIKRMQSGLPYVRCKMAMSVDGRTAMASGESKWITGPDARSDVQRLRARSCAIITGVDSVIYDDPSLTVRLDEHARQPLRIIVDTHGRCPAKADILNQPGSTIVVAAMGVTLANYNVWNLPTRAGRIDLYALLKKLGDEGCNEVLVESGATLAGAFAASGHIDEFIIYLAPKLMGSTARPLFELPLEQMSAHLPLAIKEVRAVGQDWRITAVPDPEGC